MSNLAFKHVIRALCPRWLQRLWDRVEASEVGYRMAKGAFWSLVGAVVSNALALLASVVVARLLGKSIFGELGIVRSTTGMFGTLAGLSLGLTATKHVSEYRRTDPSRAGRIMALSGIVAFVSGALVAVACFLLAPWLAEHALAAPQLAGLLRIGCLVLFLEAVTGAQTGALAGMEAFKTIARLSVAVGLLNFPLLVVAAWFGGIHGAVWATVANSAAKWGLSHWALRREAASAAIPFGLEGWWREREALWRFSLPSTLGGLIAAPVSWITSAMLVNQPGGYAEMGVYSAANQWFFVVLFLPSLLGTVLLPVLSEQVGGEETSRARGILRMSILVNLLIVTPLVAAGIVASPWIMASYGPGFADGARTLAVSLLTGGAVAAQYPVAQVFNAKGKAWASTFLNLGWGVSFLILAWMFVSSGALGVAGARAVAYLIQAAGAFSIAAWLLKAETADVRDGRRARPVDAPECVPCRKAG